MTAAGMNAGGRFVFIIALLEGYKPVFAAPSKGRQGKA
jgi:hypothetical protein